MRRQALLAVVLASAVSFLLGALLSGGVPPMPAVALSGQAQVRPPAARPAKSIVPLPGAVNFADVAERINAAVVNIDAATRAGHEPRRRRDDGDLPRDFDLPRQGSGSGFIIDRQGFILTNFHVIENADRITVTLADGRALRGEVVGSDPAIDVALIKVSGEGSLPEAPLGNSDDLRVGEWVCAIGNPLGYVHSVTVGVVSFIGRKLFDASLDDYIQTDAAINFGNSGGPLINSRGEVIGINAAISSRASSIGFAVPINGASSALPQLRARGRVSRGYMGVGLRDVDADLERSLKLSVDHGALVQDITAGSPADRAGLRPYDVITSLDDRVITNDDQLIREISARAPGTAARLRLMRDGHDQTLTVKLAERPARERQDRADPSSPAPDRSRVDPENAPLGLTVRDLDPQTADRLDVPNDVRGVLITRVEGMSSSFDGGIERGTILLEINRQRIETAAEYRRIARAARPGDVLTLYIYAPDLEQRQLKTIRVEDR